ncbi:MAG: hypothetical protein ACREQV_26245, partial [Candidatus Binatia bacterium]
AESDWQRLRSRRIKPIKSFNRYPSVMLRYTQNRRSVQFVQPLGSVQNVAHKIGVFTAAARRAQSVAMSF